MATEEEHPQRKSRKTYSSKYQLKTYIQTLTKELLPNIATSGEAKNVLTELCRLFIHRIIQTTNLSRTTDDKSTLSENHVRAAIRMLDNSEDMNNFIQQFLDEYAKSQKEEKKSTERVPLNRRLGLVFSVSRVERIAKLYKTESKSSPKAFIALTAALEYLMRAVLEGASELLDNSKNKTLATSHIKRSVAGNEQLNALFGHSVIGGGYVPNCTLKRDTKNNKIVTTREQFVFDTSDEDLEAISNAVIHKLCYRVGIVRVSKQCIDECKRVVYDMLAPIVQAAETHAHYSKRKTLMWYDLNVALFTLGSPTIVNTFTESNSVGSSFNKCPQPPVSKRGETARKVKTGTKSLRMVKFYQKNSNNLLLPRATFTRLVQNAINTSSVRLSEPFKVQLQLYIESQLLNILDHAAEVSTLNGRDTVTAKAVNLSYKYYTRLTN